tara:strand:+ start:735 stop:1184 length:450 start_codon:yes stop_codon:yes gene_type:complete
MQIIGEYEFKAKREIVWNLLLKPSALKQAIPGIKDFEQIGEQKYALQLSVGIASVKGSYTGEVQVSHEQPYDTYRLTVTGKGKPGSIQSEIDMTLTETGDTTTVYYVGNVHARGTIARLGNRLIKGTAGLLAGQFFKAMENQLTIQTKK